MSEELDQTGTGRRDEDAPPPMPRWMKYLAVVLLALIAVALLAMLLVGGEHGPGRHSAPDAPTQAGRTVVTAL